MNASRARGNGAEEHFGGGYGKIGPVMLTQPDAVHADLVGKHRLINHIPDHLSMGQHLPVRTRLNVAEGVKTKFDLLRHRSVHRCLL